MMKRFLCTLLCITVILSMMPLGTSIAFADNAQGTNPSYEDLLNQPLCFTAVEAGAEVRFVKDEGAPDGVKLKYTTDSNGSSGWKEYAIGDTVTLTNIGDKVFFKANNQNAGFGIVEYATRTETIYIDASHTSTYEIPYPIYKCNKFETGKVDVSGNIMSLLNEDVFSKMYYFPDFYDYCFLNLFYGTDICSAENLVLSATGLKPGCYSRMFAECKNLEKAPKLPAQTMEQSCYGEMFLGCTSLKEAPELPATEMKTSCYSGMFSGCTSLEKAPELPAMTLAGYCYQLMFASCTSLKEAPELPAKEPPAISTSEVSHGTADGFYYGMFENCTSLEKGPALPITTLTLACYAYMFYGCTSLKTAPALPAIELKNGCYSYMFSGCSSLEDAPALPAENINSNGAGIYTNCKLLTDIIVASKDAPMGLVYGGSQFGKLHCTAELKNILIIYQSILWLLAG